MWTRERRIRTHPSLRSYWHLTDAGAGRISLSRDAGLEDAHAPSSRWLCTHAHTGSTERTQWELRECFKKREHMHLGGESDEGVGK